MPSVNIASLRDEFDVYKADITSLQKEYKRGERPLACSEPPAGHAHWSLRPLEKQVVEPGIVEATSDTTIHRCSKNQLNPHQNRYWVMPKANAAFEAVLEDVPEVYTRPHDPARPLVYLDETSRQLTCETRTAIPARPSRAA